MNLKQALENDIDRVFLNRSEFAEEVTIDGFPLLAVITENAVPFKTSMGNLGDVSALGLLQAERTLCVATTALPRPLPEQRLHINGEWWLVQRVEEEMDMLTLFLNRAWS